MEGDEDSVRTQNGKSIPGIPFLPQHLEIHWFSIINSCVTVLLLTGFFGDYFDVRVLKNILSSTRDDETGEEQEETDGSTFTVTFSSASRDTRTCSVRYRYRNAIAFYGLVCITSTLVGEFISHNRGCC